MRYVWFERVNYGAFSGVASVNWVCVAVDSDDNVLHVSEQIKILGSGYLSDLVDVSDAREIRAVELNYLAAMKSNLASKGFTEFQP